MVYRFQSLLEYHFLILLELVFPLILCHYFYFANPPYPLLYYSNSVIHYINTSSAQTSNCRYKGVIMRRSANICHRAKSKIQIIFPLNWCNGNYQVTICRLKVVLVSIKKTKINVLENCRRCNGGNRDYCSHFSLIFKTFSGDI